MQEKEKKVREIGRGGIELEIFVRIPKIVRWERLGGKEGKLPQMVR